MTRPVGSRLAAAVDAAVLWRLGLIGMGERETRAPWSSPDPDAYWASSRVGSPPAVDARDTGRAASGARVVRLTAPSAGPGGEVALRGRAALVSPEAPLVLLLHGYAAPVPWYEDHHARRLRRLGLSTARIELPFHMGRRVPGKGHGDGFFSVEPERTCAVLRQAVEDAAAVVAWARSQGAPRVGVLGFSLGGLVACLLAARVPLDATVAITPPADLTHVILDLAPRRLRRLIGTIDGGGGPWGADAAASRPVLAAALAPVTPARLRPVTTGDRVTLVSAAADRIVGAEPVRELARAWDAECWEYPHGHVTVMTARGLSRRIHDRLATRLRTGAAAASAA